MIAIELKASNSNQSLRENEFYLELLDELEKQEDDNPSIGIILCPEKDDGSRICFETSNKPIGVAEYQLTNELPDSLKGKHLTEKN